MKPARARILDAADQLMRTIGLARATTKEIAREAGCSEAALYKYFANKEDLFLHVLEERLPRLGPLLAELTEDLTGHSVEENLVAIVRQAARFYESSFSIGASLFAEPTLLRRHAEGVHALGSGPHKPIDAVSAYLRVEREAGRIAPDTDTEAAAALLMGACMQRAFLHAFPDSEPVRPLDDFAPALARTVLRGIRPEDTPAGSAPSQGSTP
ncbi:TetR/AcrR family transcriptional regulator [Streptomyces sp. NPDC051219]|uniref:TetR/AcrR family transcriptional regulator n=1 Tax=Streptomyces sp. NPDC051219 TaxID=3155283 RepID=UPI003423456A